MVLPQLSLKVGVIVFYMLFFGGMVWIKTDDVSKRNAASERVSTGRDGFVGRLNTATTSFDFAVSLFSSYQAGRLDDAALDEVIPAALMSNPLVFKMRILSAAGIELINYSKWEGSDGFYVEKQTSLQDKSGKEYYLEARNQSLFLSALDLNKENGEIYVPWIHTIRAAGEVGPVDGNGIVVVSLRLNSENEANFPEGTSTSLYDSDGFCLANCPAGEFMGFHFGRDPPFTDVADAIAKMHEKRDELPNTHQEQFVSNGMLITIGKASAVELCTSSCDLGYRVWYIVDRVTA